MAARLPRERLARGRTLSIIEGSFATAMASLTGGAILTGFALWLGAGPFQIGPLTSLPAFAALVQLLAPYFTEKRGERKSLVVSTVAGQRLLWLAIAALPFLVLPAGIGIWLLIGLVTVSSMLGAIGGIPWLSWMGDLVPKEMRGRYFAARSLVMGVVGLILGPLVGQFLDLWKDRPGIESAYGFVILFVAGLAFGLLSHWLLRRIAEPRMVRGPSEPFLKRLRLPWQNVNFRRFIFFRGYYVFVVNLAGPFFTVFLLQQLGLSFGLIYILNTISTLSNLVSLRWWGPLCDRWGTKKVMVVTTLGKGLFPLTYVAMAVTSPGVPTPATWVLPDAVAMTTKVARTFSSSLSFI